MALSMSHHPRRSHPLRCVQQALPKAPPAPVCSGCSTSATEASVNAPATNRIISPTTTMPTVVRTPYPRANPPSQYEGSMTLTLTFMAGKDQEFDPKLDGLIRPTSSTTFIMLASTPPMLPRWYLTDPSGRPLLADCQHSNPSKDFVKISVLGRTHLE